MQWKDDNIKPFELNGMIETIKVSLSSRKNPNPKINQKLKCFFLPLPYYHQHLNSDGSILNISLMWRGG